MEEVIESFFYLRSLFILHTEEFINDCECNGEIKIMISIIVPVYNLHDYLLNCLQSIGNQTYKDF